MHSALSYRFFNGHPKAEWFFIKISLMWIWLKIVHGIFLDTGQVPYPDGICRFFDCSVLVVNNASHYFYVAAVVLAVFYLCEKWMAVTTLMMFLLSLLLFTLEESNGILNRCALYTMVFLAQSIAYYKGGDKLRQNRIQYAVQIIAAGYFLAGSSKLIASGFHWITDAPQASIQILKNYSYAYFDTGNYADLQQGLTKAHFVLQHKFFVILLFGASLFLELTAWVALTGKRNTFIYGLLLLGMHMGILFFMDILIVAIFYPMLIFMVNPMYVGYFVVCEGTGWVKDRFDH